MQNTSRRRGCPAGAGSRKRNTRFRHLAAASLVALAVVPLTVAGNGFDVRNGTTAGGGGVASAGRFSVIWTIGEPAMGTTETGGFRVTSGFPATIGTDDFQGVPTDGAIFKDGFEDSSGDSQ